MKYSDIIGVDELFDSAFNITAEKSSHWKTFISNERFEENLLQITNVFTSPELNQRKSIWIQGTYGTGKSHSTSVIKHLLFDDLNSIQDYLPKITKSQVKEGIKNFRKGNKVFPVVLKGTYAIADVVDMMYTIQVQVTTTLKEYNIEIATKSDFEAMIEMLDSKDMTSFFQNILETDLKKFVKDKSQLKAELQKNNITVLRVIVDRLKKMGLNHFSKNIIIWLQEVKQELESKKIANYLMLYWDEFTSLMEIAERRSILNLIQDIAELSKAETESKNPVGIYVFLVTHKNLEVIESYKELKEDEKRMAKARFLPLTYDMQPNTTYHILSGALVKKDPDSLNNLIEKNIINTLSVSEVLNNIVPSDTGNAEQIKKRIISLYPFHPYTAYLATFVSRIIGDAERSVFEFLNDENLGFRGFLKNDIESHPFLSADCVWDFFYKMFDENNSNKFEAVTNKYKLHIDKLKDKGNEYTAVFKVVLLLNILYRATTSDQDFSEKNLVNPKEQNIISAFSGILNEDTVHKVLQYIDDEQIVHRNPDGIYEVAFSALPASRVLEEKKKLYPQKEDISKIVEEYNHSCKGALNKIIAAEIMRQTEIMCFWGGEKEHTLRAKLNSKFQVDYALHVALFLFRGETKELDKIIGKAESSQADLKNLLITLSKEEEFSNTIFISIAEPLGNKRFELYMDSIARETVAGTLKLDEEMIDGKKSAEKWIKQWITSIISSSFTEVIFQGTSLRLPFIEISKKIKSSIINSIFKNGLDSKPVTSTIWNKQNAKTVVERILYSFDRSSLEHELTGALAPIKFLLRDSSGNYIFDETLNLIQTPTSSDSIAALCISIKNEIDKLRGESTVDLGRTFLFLKKPPYGYYQNPFCMAGVALALRPFIGKFYKSGNGQKIDKTLMKSIVISLFDYWENNKFHDEMIVRFSTEEEQELTEELSLLFNVHKDGLIETKWAIRDKFQKNNKSPLWSLKYWTNNSQGFDILVDKLFEFAKSPDENILEKDINELLSLIKEYRIELSQSLDTVENINCIESYLAKLLNETHTDNVGLSKLLGFLSGELSNDQAFWEEEDVKSNVYKWIAQRKSAQDSEKNPPENKNGKPDNNTDGCTFPNSEIKKKKIKERLAKKAQNADFLEQIIIKLIDKHDMILNDLDEWL